MNTMTIGEAAKASGVPAKMIRYYESIGLIPKAVRSDGGYRHFAINDIHTLRFIRRGRDFGFSIEAITRLLALWRDRNRASAEVKQIALEHAAALRTKIADLQAMLGPIERLAEQCQGDHRPDCPIMDDLADIGGRLDIMGGPKPDAAIGQETFRSHR